MREAKARLALGSGMETKIQPDMKGPRLLWSPAIFRKSAKIALVVGTVLNVINQKDALFGSATISYFEFVLNYCVPLSVAYCSACWNQR